MQRNKLDLQRGVEVHLFFIYPSAVAALLESEFSPVTSSSNGSFFNGSSELRSFSGSAMACSKGCSADEQTPMARASGVLALDRSARWCAVRILRGLLCGTLFHCNRPFPVVTR